MGILSSDPGTYEIQVKPIDGYEQVAPQFVVIPQGKLVQHVIELRRAS